MHSPFLHSWGTDFSRPVYRAGVSAEVSVGTGGGKEGEKMLPDVEYDPNKRTAGEQWAAIDEKYGQSAYQDIILNRVEELLPTGPADYRTTLVMDSTKRYMRSYRDIKLNFMDLSKKLEDEFIEAVDGVKEKTRSELDLLRSAVEGSRKLIDFKEAMPNPEDKSAVKEHFKEYLDALNGRYFNADLNEGEGYKSKASDYKKNMSNWVSARLNWMLDKKETKKEDLEVFKADVSARYQSFASIDGNPSIISSVDLRALEVAANPPEAMKRVLDESDEQTIKRLELVQLMNPDAWKEVVEIKGEVIIQAAINNGAQNAFVAEVKKYKPDVEDFDDATKEFRKMLNDISKVGVRETLEFSQQFNMGVHGEVLKYEISVKPPALAMQVTKQLDYLLDGHLTPQWDTDRMLVRFMNSNLKGRNDILANDGTREVLFRAIRQSTEQYPEIYDKQFANIPDDVTKLKRSKYIEKPTHHDQAAQLQALIILGNQAKVIVSQLELTLEHAGKNYTEEISQAQIPEDPSVVKTGLRFKAPGKENVRFQSALERGGFNTRDLALKGAKVFGVVTVLCNVAQSWSETSGDFMDRVFETAEKAAANQGLLIGAAVTVGSHLAERDKRFLRYPWLSQHERASTVAAFKLDNIGARVSYKEMNRFLHNNAEWRALSDPAMDAAQIKEMLGEAAKRTASGSYPAITIADLRKVIKDESIIATLTTGGKSARTRYLFYKNFFAGSVKPDVNQTKEICTGTSHISPSPAKTN